VALNILDNNSDELLRCKDDGEAMPVLGSYLENVTNRDTTMPTVDHTNMMCTDNVPKKVTYMFAFSGDIKYISSSISRIFGKAKYCKNLFWKLSRFESHVYENNFMHIRQDYQLFNRC
jgi:hypothetical protein